MKQKIITNYLLILLVILPFSLSAQQEVCGFDQKHREELLRDPEYARNVEYLNRLIANRSESAESRSAVVHTIPVVVHVIHTGEAVGTGPNITTSQINSAINNLTDAYRNTGYMGVDIEIEFCLATLDKDCGTTTGIIRMDGTGTGGAGDKYENVGITTTNELAVKALSRWPADQYYNIWVVTEIDDNDGGSGTQGYAYFPGANPDRDGAVMLYNAFGYDPGGASGHNLKNYTNLNATAIHELGHALDLYHTFEGDSNGSSCPTGSGDECADTDPHIRNADPCFTCASGTTNTCVMPTGSIDDLVANFMNYSCGTCKDRFTSDQKTRLRAGLETGRPGLTTSVGCGSVPTLPTSTLSCTPSTAYVNNGFGMGITKFQLNGIEYYSYHAERDVTAYNSTTSYFQTCMTTTLMEGSMYSVSVENGTANNEDVKVYIDYNDDGDFSDMGEEVFSSTGAMTHSGNITIPNSTAATEVWIRVISDWAGNNISGPCYEPQYGQVEDYSATIQGSVPVEFINFTGQKKGEAIELFWNTASELNNDYFTLERSVNGRDFETISKIDGAGTSFENQIYRHFDKSPALGINYYRLSQTDFDGTKTTHPKIVAVNFTSETDVQIRPNPVIENTFQLAYNTTHSGHLDLEIYNVTGALIYQNHFAVNKEMNYIDLTIPDLSNGAYIVQARQNNKVFNTRFVKAGK